MNVRVLVSVTVVVMLNINVKVDWPRRVGTPSSSGVPGPPRPDSGHDFGTEYSGRVMMLISSIRAES